MAKMKQIKDKITQFIYKCIEKWYFKLRNKLDSNIRPLINSYDGLVNEDFEGCNYTIYNPVNYVYLALKQVFGDTLNTRIYGIAVDFDRGQPEVHIATVRPGIIIGFHGKDIDALTEILTAYFGKEPRINLMEHKAPTFINYDAL